MWIMAVVLSGPGGRAGVAPARRERSAGNARGLGDRLVVDEADENVLLAIAPAEPGRLLLEVLHRGQAGPALGHLGRLARRGRPQPRLEEVLHFLLDVSHLHLGALAEDAFGFRPRRALLDHLPVL